MYVDISCNLWQKHHIGQGPVYSERDCIFNCHIANKWVSFQFFLNDVCQVSNMPKLYVMVKWLPKESVSAYFWIFIFHILMYKCNHKSIYHMQIPKKSEHSPMNLFGSLLTITYRVCQIVKLAKYLENFYFLHWRYSHWTTECMKGNNRKCKRSLWMIPEGLNSDKICCVVLKQVWHHLMMIMLHRILRKKFSYWRS